MPTCLVVDDSAIIRKLAVRMLTNLDIRTVEAENGAQALEQCAISAPDIVLLDWNMPVLNGIEFLRALRANRTMSQPKVLFCTTESEFSRILEAMQSGADEYIMKPFDEDILASKLKLLSVL
jgi:two-component system chemotaxis response regulator CheY